ncbi:MAG TPA: hypothetical protein ENN08_05715 [Bacteroidales bacterium]|nr:hypothetical protein [Bacteroidales bacterium]
MNKIKQFFRKDNLAFGIVLALLMSILTYSVLSVAALIFPETFSSHYLRKQVLLLISVFVNLFSFRMYMVSLKFEKTGRGILAAVFVLMVMYFVFLNAE